MWLAVPGMPRVIGGMLKIQAGSTELIAASPPLTKRRFNFGRGKRRT
jgi:hypothetical protein